jgi:formate dehydrogenase subunit gamma
MATELMIQRAEVLAREHADMEGALLPLLHAVQDEFGYVDDVVIPAIAEALNFSRAEVHGVLSFYHLFRRTPPGRRELLICRAESCQAMGGRDLEQAARDSLGIDFHQTTPDGGVSLEPVYCLGNCACSPSIMLDGAVHSRVTREKLQQLLEESA